MITRFKIFEKKQERKPAKEGLEKSHLPKEIKEKIYPYIDSDSYYSNKVVYDLNKSEIKDINFNGVSLGADKNGFFVYTHRSRTNSYKNIDEIPINKIAFVKSTR